MENIPLFTLKSEVTQLKPKLSEAIDRVLESGVFIGGPEVKNFEAQAGEYLGIPSTVSVNSGTDALVIGLRALGVKPGDEVITTPFTFFATAESIMTIGATPVLVDIDERTFNISPEAVEAAITDRTTAVIPVHLFGHPCELDRLVSISEKHSLKLVEDTAQAFGLKWGGRSLGTIGDAGTFSFFPTKNLGAYGDGGLICFKDKDHELTARKLKSHGGLDKYNNELVGYNSRLDALQAAVLSVKLERVDANNKCRQEIASRYAEALSSVDEIVTPPEGGIFHQYTVRVKSRDRDKVAAKLKDQGIATAVYYRNPINKVKAFTDAYGDVQLPVAELASQEVLSLPIWPEFTIDQQNRVIEALKSSLRSS